MSFKIGDRSIFLLAHPHSHHNPSQECFSWSRQRIFNSQLSLGRFHALRHSFASALITDNQSAKLVQTLLGHHGAAFTMDVYSDLWPTALEGIGERIGATLFSGDGSKVVAVTRENAPSDGPSEAQVFDLNGGPCRDRTYDKEIKSLLLYQLS